MASATPPPIIGTLLLPVGALLLFLISLEMTSSSSSPWYALGAESSSSSLNLIHFILRLVRERREGRDMGGGREKERREGRGRDGRDGGWGRE